MSEQATISVVIPTFNSSRFIDETLASVIGQTLRPSEIIVVDDASTDDTMVKVRLAQAKSPVPIRLISLPSNSGGPALPMNVGIGGSTGKYVALLDHDDSMLPQKLRLQMDCFHALPEAELVFGDYVRQTEHGEEMGISAEDYELIRKYGTCRGEFYWLPRQPILIHQIVHTAVIMSCSNLVFSKSIWEKCGPFDLRHSAIADYLFKLRVAACSPVGFVPQVLFNKRGHRNNLFDKASSPELMQSIWQAGFRSLRSIGRINSRYSYLTEIVGEELLSRAWHCQNRCQIRKTWSHFRRYATSVGFDRRLLRQLIKFPFGCMRSWLRSCTGPANAIPKVH